MSNFLAVVSLFGISIVWFGLPLLPTILEIRKRREARPLSVDRENDGEVRHFARRFKAYLESNFVQPTLQECVARGAGAEGQFSDGTPYRIVARNEAGPVTQGSKFVSGIAIFPAAVVLPDFLEFVHGIYSAEDIDCGRESLIRSLYGARDARLREGSVVLRWLHVEQRLVAAAGCALYGRASAEQSMHIGAGVQFERLHSKRIIFGEEVAAAPPANGETHAPFAIERLNAHRMAGNCYAVDQDLYVPPGARVVGDFVVRGAVRISRDAQVEGSIKSYDDMRIEDGAFIQGSVISGRDIEIGNNCHIRGPAVASRRMTIHSGCRIGLENFPTSAIAPTIVVDPGVLVFGAVWARSSGKAGG